MVTGQCKYPRAYKPPPKNIKRPNKPTPAPPSKRHWCYVEMQYKTPKGMRWKIFKREMLLSDKMIEHIAKVPIEETLRILLFPMVSAIAHFKLIKMSLSERENG